MFFALKNDRSNTRSIEKICLDLTARKNKEDIVKSLLPLLKDEIKSNFMYCQCAVCLKLPGVLQQRNTR